MSDREAPRSELSIDDVIALYARAIDDADLKRADLLAGLVLGRNDETARDGTNE